MTHESAMNERIDHHNFDSFPPEEREFRQEGVMGGFEKFIYCLLVAVVAAFLITVCRTWS